MPAKTLHDIPHDAMIQVRRTLKGEIWIEAVDATGEPVLPPRR